MATVLASASPRRKTILEMLGVKGLRVVPATGDEIIPEEAGPAETVECLSAAKALEVAKNCSQSDVIIAADTIVWLHERILGKPSDAAEAAAMLEELSGTCHEVYAMLLQQLFLHTLGHAPQHADDELGLARSA